MQELKLGRDNMCMQSLPEGFSVSLTQESDLNQRSIQIDSNLPTPSQDLYLCATSRGQSKAYLQIRIEVCGEETITLADPFVKKFHIWGNEVITIPQSRLDLFFIFSSEKCAETRYNVSFPDAQPFANKLESHGGEEPSKEYLGQVVQIVDNALVVNASMMNTSFPLKTVDFQLTVQNNGLVTATKSMQLELRSKLIHQI